MPPHGRADAGGISNLSALLLGGGSMNMMQAALRYAASGKPIFPVNPQNKQPLVKDWRNVATTDEAQIRKWWARFPQAMIGLPTGRVSGVWVVDCDGPEGRANFKALCAEHGYTPQTLRAKTKRGFHYYFIMPAGVDR